MTNPYFADSLPIGSPPPVLFENVLLVDPKTGNETIGNLASADGKIVGLGPDAHQAVPSDCEKVDASNMAIAPGLIDMHVSTGEPGFEHQSTLATASRAAAAGGVTTIICMPHTEPVIDEVALVDFIERRARDTAIVNVHPMAAMTKRLKGEQMSELGLLYQAGAVAFTNGKYSIANAQIMRRILSYSRDFDALIVHQTEDPDLARDGVMNEGAISGRLGLPGIPKAAEIVMLERDIRLVELTGGRYHADQISCAESLEVIREAKKAGLPVTCGVSINHLTLCENELTTYRTFLKMNPPLRSHEDRLAMVEGVKDGSIDVIVSAHDPKDADGKRRPFEEAARGAVGLETLLSAGLRLYHSGDLTLSALLRPMTINPARLLKLPEGRLKVGAPADLVLFNVNMSWQVISDDLHSQSRNTPFDKNYLDGRVVRTYVNGRLVYDLAPTPTTN